MAAAVKALAGKIKGMSGIIGKDEATDDTLTPTLTPTLALTLTLTLP